MYEGDTYEDGTVFRFQKWHDATGQLYLYVILKAAGRWYRTGRDCPSVPQEMDWPQVIAWLASGSDPVPPSRMRLLVELRRS